VARGRIISPEFWTDGNMIGLSFAARLFYIGLWNFTYCDKGHLPDDVVGLKLRILPADPVDATALLAELMSCGRVVRLTDGERSYLHIPTLEGHQKTDTRWKSRCPVCNLPDSANLTETLPSLVEHAETLPSSALREDKTTEKKTSSPAVTESDFEAAWSHWPKKTERKKSFEKFKAVARIRGLDALTTDVVRFGDAYARTTERQFVPALVVWLNGDRWTDDLPGAQPASRGTPRVRTIEDIRTERMTRREAQNGA
jgi:hypothetical protein